MDPEKSERSEIFEQGIDIFRRTAVMTEALSLHLPSKP
jgi:hypothetical protein